jgi:hypothetical protein
LILKLTWTSERPLYRDPTKNKTVGFALPNAKTSCKALNVKFMCSWKRDRQIAKEEAKYHIYGKYLTERIVHTT